MSRLYGHYQYDTQNHSRERGRHVIHHSAQAHATGSVCVETSHGCDEARHDQRKNQHFEHVHQEIPWEAEVEDFSGFVRCPDASHPEPETKADDDSDDHEDDEEVGLQALHYLVTHAV